MSIGTHVKANGQKGVVVSTSEISYYGHCPAGMLIVRLPGGVTVVPLGDCEPL